MTNEEAKMQEQWQELKETIIELRDNDGTGTQQEVCKFLVNYMGVLEKQMVEQEPTVDVLEQITAEIYEEFMTIDGGVHDKSVIKCMEIIGKYKGDKE